MPGFERFIFWLNAACLGAQGLLQLDFSARVTGGRQRSRHVVLYLAALFLMDAAAGRLSLPFWAGAGLQLTLLYGANRVLLRAERAGAALAAALAMYIFHLAFGLAGSLETLFFPCLAGGPALCGLLLAASAAALALGAGCCRLAVRALGPAPGPCRCC